MVILTIKELIMFVTILKNKKQYLKAMERFHIIFQAKSWTPEWDERDFLWLLIQHYEDIHYPIPELDQSKQ